VPGSGRPTPPKSGGRFDNVEFCVWLDFYCERYKIDPATYFTTEPHEEHLRWSIRSTVGSTAGQWRLEQEKIERASHGVDDAPKPRSAEELQQAAAIQNETFERLDKMTAGGGRVG
jgi:hypothetical protein